MQYVLKWESWWEADRSEEDSTDQDLYWTYHCELFNYCWLVCYSWALWNKTEKLWLVIDPRNFQEDVILQVTCKYNHNVEMDDAEGDYFRRQKSQVENRNSAADIVWQN